MTKNPTPTKGMTSIPITEKYISSPTCDGNFEKTNDYSDM